MALDLVFMGTPDFAVPSLDALVDAGHRIVAVYTQPPRPAGRGMAERRSPVHERADALGFAVRTPHTFKDEIARREFSALGADAAVVAAYGLLLPRPVLDAPRLGCFNVHGSRLPRWRGAAPIQRAIMAGDTLTAVDIMRMEEGLDTGPVCLVREIAIDPETTAGELHDALALAGASLIADAMRRLEAGTLQCIPQPREGVTYAAKIGKDETRLDLSLPARAVKDKIRALSPYPGAWLELVVNGKPDRIKVLGAETVAEGGVPGVLLDDKLTIACGSDAIRLLTIQRAGKQPLSAAEFLRGARVTSVGVPR